MAVSCLALLLTILSWGLARIWSAWSSGKHWGSRRRRLVILALLQTTVNVTFWLTPHTHILATSCGWFDAIIDHSGVIQWTMWNTIFLTLTVSAHNSNPWLHKGKPVSTSPDPLILDAPIWYHAPKLLLWCGFQGTIISEAVMGNKGDQKDACNWKNWEGSCAPVLRTKIISIIWGVLSVGYFVVYVYYNTRARVRLEKLPYNRFRTGNLLQNWQRRQGKWIMNFMVASVLTSWYFSWNHCSGYFTTWLGVFPLEVVVTGAMVANSLFMFPMPASKVNPGVQTLLQGFSWSEATRKDDLAQRNLLLGPHVKNVKKQAMFCLETAVKLLTFSWVVYDDTTPPAAEKEVHIDIPDPKSNDLPQTLQAKEVEVMQTGDTEKGDREHMRSVSLDSQKAAEIEELTRAQLMTMALSFYDLQHTHIIHEKDPDTKVLVSWNNDTIVVAFRGTASLKNAWRAEHVPKRGRFWLGRRPLVHKGFWRSWSAHGIGDRVMDFIGSLLVDSKLPAADWHVYITGHSLGGALATLAAYDIQTAFGFKDLQVYTYGAPRTGNHAFAREYEALIPETWHVVHDSDVIPRVGKFVRMYKRPGARVIIDRKGSIVVRPSALELHLRPTCRSLKAHYLKSYQSALGGVLRAQFCPLKAFVGGRRAALSLADSPRVSSYLCSTGLDLVALSESDSSLGDATDSDAASVTSDDVPSRMPAWAHALMDQVMGTSLESNIARAAHITRQPRDDHDLVTGSIQESAHSLRR
ncbi:alpha/beta-hydrolase [Coccomyxa subellipsoidea C-169]|uniref:Alpha/beta-hydrolase n=1 Tax=Coccomyxa subellipsoidea (strain C-169) TaxID=574566 RepID=I0Z0Y1_COCSC|nr:alpha/beta-hydrolase [Coccomyxa subellipsoidea C-169]EIE24300.1 alpha/beta-hydrolase [Coccomyxa subellipsoidea C-169]|eukprot:XP_005648844.1 alpha/beta-hydrolase [Coccomyxa subellipsoidea C-169]